MSETRQNVKAHLQMQWGAKVRETAEGFKVNVEELDKDDLNWLDTIPANVKLLIKRSGTGLVIIIT